MARNKEKTSYANTVICLMMLCMRPILRKLLRSTVKKQSPRGRRSWGINEFLANNKERIERELLIVDQNNMYRNVLYPPDEESPRTDIHKWDLTLYLFIFIDICRINRPKAYFFKQLFGIRNDFCKSSNSAITRDICKDYRKRIKRLRLKFYRHLRDDDLKDKIEERANEIESGEMSSSEIEEVLQRWKDLEVSKVMSDAKKKNGLDKFLTVKTLLSKCCAEVMRTLVIETAKRNEPPKDHTGHWSLDRFLRQYKNRIERRIHTIDKLGRPMDILFPRKGKTKLDEWDESLLSFILLNVCFLDEHMADNVADIRKVRNETSHNSKALNMTDSQYESYLERLKRSIKACLDFIDNRDLSSFINAQVSEIEFDEVDENEKMRRLQSIYQKDREDQEKLKNASEVYERMENELSEIVKEFKGIEMPEHQLELVIKNSSQELEKKLSKCIVEKINELVKSKKRLPSSSENDDDIEMTIAVANLLEKWKSKGWVITEAIKGSVLLNVRCSTFDDVCYMYNTHKGEGSNMHVSDLQTALQEVIGLDVKLSLVMHDCEMETFMEKIVSSLLSRSKALTSLNTNGDRNDTKVRLYMKRCLPNVPTLTDVDLKELDGHLRRIAEVLEKKNDLPSVSLHVCEEEMQSEVKADLQIGESMQMTGQLNPILDRLDLEMDSLDSNKQTMEMETGWPHGLIEEKEKMETVQDLSEEPEPHTTRYEHLDLYEKMFGMEFTSNNMKKFEMKSDKTDGQADVPDVAKGHECRTISNSHCSSSSETESTYNSSAEERGGLMNKPDRNWFRVRRAWKYRYLKEGLKGPADDIVQKMHDSRTMEQSVEERFDRITSILEDDKELKVRLDTQQVARSVKMRNIDIEGQTGKLDTMCHHREEEKKYLIRKQDKDPEEYLRNHNSIETIIDSWKSTPLSGKSSIINAIRSQGKTQAATAPISSTVDTSYIMETEMNSEQGIGEGTRPELQVKLVKDYIRFRYMSEKYPNKRGAKPKHSEVDDNDKDCLAEVMIKNYNGAAKIIAYCVDEKRMLLPYNLFGDLCHSGVYVCRYKFRPEKAPLRLQKVSVTTPIAKEYKDNLKNQLAILSEAGIHDIKFNDLVEDKQIGFVMFKAILDDGDGEILSQISTPFQNKIDTNIIKDCCDESVYAFDSEECSEKSSDCPLPEWGEYKDLKKYLRDDNSIETIIDSWKSTPVNIAVTGQSGSGKSSFINAMRGLKEEDVGAAQVGEKETASKCCSYNHPRHEKLILWDLPGVGTDKFPQKTYMESIHASRYDYFLIVCSGRFHSQDIWLANEVLKQKDKNRCYFVRLKVDIDMKNRKSRHALEKGTMTDADLFLNFRVEMISDILKTLHNPKVNIPLFLVSSHYPSKYDFEDLQLQLLEDASDIKRLSLTFGMTGLTKKLMEHKRNALRLRQREIALLSYKAENTNAKVVFPCDIMLLRSEIKFYKEQLSLDREGLAYVASSVGLQSRDLRKKVEMKSVSKMSKDSLIKSLTESYRSRYTNQTNLTKLQRYCMSNDMLALKTIETFLQGQLDQAMRDTENLIDFITNMNESSVV